MEEDFQRQRVSLRSGVSHARAGTDLDNVDKRHLVLPPALARAGRALLTRPPAAQQPVLDLPRVVLGRDLEPRQVARKQARDLRQVPGLHLAPARRERLGRDSKRFGETRERLTARDVSEADIDELGRVERPMVVARDGDGRREDDAGRVDGLEDAVEVTPPRHLLDENRGKPLGPQLLVDNEKVDLGGVEQAVALRQGPGGK